MRPKQPLVFGGDPVQVQAEPVTSLAWEELVTEGHVRAARLRWLQPWLYALGVIGLLVGFWLFGQVKPKDTVNTRDASLTAQVTAAQRRALIAFNGLPAPTVREEDIPKIRTAPRVVADMDAILVELNRSDKLPGKDQIPIQTVSPSEFWRKPWPIDHYVAAEKGDLKIIGVIARTPDDVGPPQLGRWLGVYRRRAGVWSMVSVNGPDFFGPETHPRVWISDIPITLKPLLKTRAGGLGGS